MQLGARPGGARAHPLPPDARDVVWRNVAQSREAREARSGLVDVYVYAVALLWSSFIVARPRRSSRKSAATSRTFSPTSRGDAATWIHL